MLNVNYEVCLFYDWKKNVRLRTGAGDLVVLNCYSFCGLFFFSFPIFGGRVNCIGVDLEVETILHASYCIYFEITSALYQYSRVPWIVFEWQ